MNQQPAVSPAESTQTQTQISPITSQAIDQDINQLTLTLQGRTLDLSGRAVSWEANIIDNEDLERKKSKVCCIFKKNRAFGESSSDESSDGDDRNAYERVPKTKAKKKKECSHHAHDNEHKA